MFGAIDTPAAISSIEETSHRSGRSSMQRPRRSKLGRGRPIIDY